jgi:hypothetical protein
MLERELRVKISYALCQKGCQNEAAGFNDVQMLSEVIILAKEEEAGRWFS